MVVDVVTHSWSQRLRSWRWAVLDGVVAVGYAMVMRGAAHPPPAVATALVQTLVVCAVLAVAARRAAPLTALVVAQGAACGLALAGAGTVGFLAPTYVVYLVPLRAPVRGAVAALAAVVVTTWASVTFGGSEADLRGDGPVDVRILTVVSVCAAVWAAGFAVRQHRIYTAGLREQAERRALAHIAEERLRIARELHDVLAHGMSLIAVQAGMANHVLTKRPDESARALESIQATSRTSLADIRRLVRMLRDGDPTDQRVDPELDPTPGLAQLPELVAAAARAGVQVRVRRRGEPRALPPGLDTTAYRIVQEALTNVVKHAGTGPALIAVSYEDDRLELRITNRGRSGPGKRTAPEAGHGLIGMRERAHLYGGELRAAPLPHGGFGVHATLPLPEPLPDHPR
jgi:signal transduction histidine kinase